MKCLCSIRKRNLRINIIPYVFFIWTFSELISVKDHVYIFRRSFNYKDICLARQKLKLNLIAFSLVCNLIFQMKKDPYQKAKALLLELELTLFSPMKNANAIHQTMT